MQTQPEEIPLQEVPYKADKSNQPQPTKINVFLILIAAIVNVLSFSVGFTSVWATPVLPKLDGRSTDNPFGRPITPTEVSLIGSLMPLGAAFGPLGAGKIANVIGRKGTLLIVALLMSFSFLIIVFTRTILLFYIARLIGGIGLGSSYALLPVYFAEISENHNRGALGCSMAIFVSLGTNFSLIVGPYLTICNFAFVGLVPLMIFITCFYCLAPETPPFLASLNEEKKLSASLLKLRNKSPEEVHLEYSNLLENAEKTQTSTQIVDLFKNPHQRKGVFISLGLCVFQHATGFGVIISYLQTIFESANVSLKPEFCVMIVGSFQLLGTFLSFLIVDRAGRRVLLLGSCCGVFVTITTLSIYFYLKSNRFQVESISWLPIVSLAIFIVSYGLGLGPVPWVLMAEFFESNVKPVAATVVSFVCFMTMFVSTIGFPILSLTIGISNCFFMFSFMASISCGFTYWMVPETKGKSVQQIQNLLATNCK